MFFKVFKLFLYIGLVSAKPVTLSREQAKTLEQKNLQYKGIQNDLTSAKNGGKIKLQRMSANSSDVPKLPDKFISSDNLNKFKTQLEKINFFTVQENGIDQFSRYGGDFEVLESIVGHLEILVKKFPDLYRENGLFLGYEDFKNIEDFALTRKNTIILNKRVFDDTDFLKKLYKNLEKENFFTKGTDYHSIIDHESGHMLMNRQKAKQKSTIRNITKITEDKARLENLSLDSYISKYISIYATKRSLNDLYFELPAELLAMLNGENKFLAEKILKEAGLL